MKIPFNKPYISGKETEYIQEAVESGHISGNGLFTKKCQSFFEQQYGFKKTLMTTSCTDALEMCALLLDIDKNDEVIVPSYTFVSSALAFVRQGAKIVFADSQIGHPNIDHNGIEELINERTKAIVVVHYGGYACDMEAIMNLARRHNLFVIEDAAQSIDAFYKGKPLGSFGNLSTFSFHETKNVQCGEGGLLVINDEKFMNRAEIIWEKGTNRSEFFRGEVDKYGWKDIGSSFLPSELNTAYLFAQLEQLQLIQKKRREIWERYFYELAPLEKKGLIKIQKVDEIDGNNAHVFYILLRSKIERSNLMDALRKKGILAVFHYQSLHRSSYYYEKHDGRQLPMSDYYTDHLLRLPFFYEISEPEISAVTTEIKDFFLH